MKSNEKNNLNEKKQGKNPGYVIWCQLCKKKFREAYKKTAREHISIIALCHVLSFRIFSVFYFFFYSNSLVWSFTSIICIVEMKINSCSLKRLLGGPELQLWAWTQYLLAMMGWSVGSYLNHVCPEPQSGSWHWAQPEYEKLGSTDAGDWEGNWHFSLGCSSWDLLDVSLDRWACLSSVLRVAWV